MTNDPYAIGGHGPTGGYSGMNDHLKKYLLNNPNHAAAQEKFNRDYTTKKNRDRAKTKKKKLVRSTSSAQ